MNIEKCLQILRDVKDVAFATVDGEGKPQVRMIDIMLVSDDRIYFCTARGKDFYLQLVNDGNVAITGMNKDYQMIRVNGRAVRLADQKMWIDRIFEENESMNSVYPGESRYILEPFSVEISHVEFFDLGKEPIFRETYTAGAASVRPKGFEITDKCIKCGKCERLCPQKCIRNFEIDQSHCLHCGLCCEECPVSAIKRR